MGNKPKVETLGLLPGTPAGPGVYCGGKGTMLFLQGRVAAMGLDVDDRARRLLARARTGHGVLITITTTYGLPGEALAATWRHIDQVERDPDVALLGVQQGVPIYGYRRIVEYARWYPIRLTARRIGPWRYFAVEKEEQVCRAMAQWARRHPGLCRQAPIYA